MVGRCAPWVDHEAPHMATVVMPAKCIAQPLMVRILQVAIPPLSR
jgi:hypothetical protein